MSQKCSISGCKSKETAIDYLGKPLCDRCWNKFSEKPVSKLREALGLKGEKYVVVDVVQARK